MEIVISIVTKITQLPFKSVKAVIQLLETEATVPFISRYRKAVTGGMDEDQIRDIQKAWQLVTELISRKKTILKSIEEQGKLTPELKAQIEDCEDPNVLEDLYLPYKPKRKTKATTALENGLGPLSDLIKEATSGDKENLIRPFVQGEIYTPKEAVQGAQYIIAEWIAEQPEIRAKARKEMSEYATCKSQKKKTEHQEAYKFEVYEDFEIDILKIKPYQTLALNRGENLNILSVQINTDKEVLVDFIIKNLKIKKDLLFYDEFVTGIEMGLSRYLLPSIEREVRNALSEVADKHAIQVFSENLKNLLLQPPLLNKVVMGIDPGFASGCKVAVIDENGNYLAGDVIYPVPPRNAFLEAEIIVTKLIERFQVDLIAIGNGTASRETEQFIAGLIKKYKLECKYLIVSEAGASVYSASAVAKKEFPDLDATQRGNISIARRAQDPLAELVKIDPKSIGVGLYQHDVNQKMLESELQAVVESCVNEVGVDLNTASAVLLSYVSGLNNRLAENIVEFRKTNKGIHSRAELLQVKGIGEKVFEQAAGFLRIRNGEEFLDNTSIHPESYPIVKNLGQELQIGKNFETIGLKLKTIKSKEKEQLLQKLNTDVHTFELIVENLLKPGRDPREDVPAPLLRSDVLNMEDLKTGMRLKGTVRNVVDFGAFVDIGLKNDALLHISKMGVKRGVSPMDVVSVGDVVDVVIDGIETDKKRVSLALTQD